MLGSSRELVADLGLGLHYSWTGVLLGSATCQFHRVRVLTVTLPISQCVDPFAL